MNFNQENMRSAYIVLLKENLNPTSLTNRNRMIFPAYPELVIVITISYWTNIISTPNTENEKKTLLNAINVALIQT